MQAAGYCLQDAIVNRKNILVWGDFDVDGQTSTSLLVAGLRQLNADLQVPTPRDFGIAEADWFGNLELMAGQALDSGSPNNNPRIPEAAEIVGLYERVYA